jgi:hypothetical protein
MLLRQENIENEKFCFDLTISGEKTLIKNNLALLKKSVYENILFP